MRIQIFTTGGTIDKTYFDAKSEYEVGEPQIGHILREAQVAFDYDVTSLFRKDSLDLTDEDRARIRQAVTECDANRVLITHGTDTMADTARFLNGIAGKTVVLTGALNPARFRSSDAVFNIGCAIAAVQVCAPGIYIAMNGQVFDGGRVRKNRAENRFEAITDTDSSD
ncbi:MAG: asparaginase domain-containing protein [Gammaproteobacteria bacterium]|jgi:L-asparaginase